MTPHVCRWMGRFDDICSGSKTVGVATGQLIPMYSLKFCVSQMKLVPDGSARFAQNYLAES